VLAVVLLAGTARADDVVYVEALGKAGAYGIGYEHVMTGRLSFGVAASYITVSDQQITTVAPYLRRRL
jgi:hypothetical protein